jgi:diaminobutyrate-2-oxoglutarate transaminase
MVDDSSIFQRLESNIRYYCRAFPALFHRGKNAILYDSEGRRWIDFFAASGILNYGHNPYIVKNSFEEFIQEDYLMQGLDMNTPAKRDFLKFFEEIILHPRKLDYKIQFCGASSSDAVEAALKLARQATGRPIIGSFTGGWHGISLGSLAITGDKYNRLTAGTPLNYGVFYPYPDGPDPIPNSMDYIQSLIEDPNSGYDKPAAFIVEMIQVDGGVYMASLQWLRDLQDLCKKHQILLIIDDIQVGSGRMGTFFSFEEAGISPDIVLLSNAMSGTGISISLMCMQRKLDIWQPGLYNGIFSGNQMALLSAGIVLDHYWRTDEFQLSINNKGALFSAYVKSNLLSQYPKIALRGKGMVWGIDLSYLGKPSVVKQIAKLCFENGLLVDRCGRYDLVIKITPPLTIEEDLLLEGCDILCSAITQVISSTHT